MGDLEKALSEQYGEKVLDVSLSNDEISQLVDGITWSPIQLNTSIKNQLVSPARQFVRRKSAELNKQASDCVVTSASPCDAGLRKYNHCDYVLNCVTMCCTVCKYCYVL